MSLRSRLTVLVALAAAPPLALVAYNTVELRTLLEQQAGEEAVASARLIAAEMSQLMDGTRHLMQTIVKHPSVPNNEAECAAHFSNVVESLAVYRQAALIDVPDLKAQEDWVVCSRRSPGSARRLKTEDGRHTQEGSVRPEAQDKRVGIQRLR